MRFVAWILLGVCPGAWAAAGKSSSFYIDRPIQDGRTPGQGLELVCVPHGVKARVCRISRTERGEAVLSKEIAPNEADRLLASFVERLPSGGKPDPLSDRPTVEWSVQDGKIERRGSLGGSSGLENGPLPYVGALLWIESELNRRLGS